jgi:squalene cyclase
VKQAAIGLLMFACAGVAMAQVAPPAPEQPGRAPTEDIDRPFDDPTRSAQNNILDDEMTPEMDRAVERGLAWLARSQNPDGSFGDGRWGRSVAITALAGLAFMADGHVPDRGQYGEVVNKGLSLILESVAENGLIAGDVASAPMYGHGFATLFLAELYGMTAGGGDSELAKRVHGALLRSIRLIESTQNEEGGWRYNPIPNDADISVTITQIMALRACRNAGLEVNKNVIDKAVEYIRKCQNPDGGFRYQMMTGASAFPRSAAGVASLQYAGIYKDEAVDRGVQYILREALPDGRGSQVAHYYYGQYYAIQAMYLAGGDAWAKWWPAARKELILLQQPGGDWKDPSVGDAYGTAMALICLQMPKRYLPIFQK